MNDKRKIEKLWYFDTEEDFSGRALELKRKVDLASYNDYETIAKSPDWVDWTDSEDLEFDFLAKRVLKTYADRFILQASEYGISRYEKMLGIEPEREEGLNERRKRVYLLWNRKIKWTHRTLIEWMNAAVGEGNYDMNILYNEYGIEFSFFVFKNFSSNTRWLAKQLRKIIPANLWIRFRIVNLHKIYYGMYAQKLKKHTIFPAKPQDKNIDLNVYFGGTVARKKVVRKLRVINIFIEENKNRYEVTGPGGEILDYER